MPNAYDNQTSADAFDKFLGSEDGQIQRGILYENILPYLTGTARVLDAACGQGWLAAKLTGQGKQVEAFDSSAALITQAKKQYPGVNFQVIDATASLPYPEGSFDAVVLNMAAHDLHDLAKAFDNLHRSLRPGGTFVMTIANPYYSFPAGVWKRGIIGRLLRRKPGLKVRPYHGFARQKGQLHIWDSNLSSYFYPLSEYVTVALAAGFNLRAFRDLGSDSDSPDYDANYRLYRFPLLLLLVFEKSGK